MDIFELLGERTAVADPEFLVGVGEGYHPCY